MIECRKCLARLGLSEFYDYPEEEGAFHDAVARLLDAARRRGWILRNSWCCDRCAPSAVDMLAELADE